MTANQQADAVVDGLVGGLRINKKVEHVYTKRRGRIVGWTSEAKTKAYVRWLGQGFYRLGKAISVEIIRRV